MPMHDANLLKLQAENLDDLKLISACLQNAYFPATAMHYDMQAKTFAILVNRFMWEHEPQGYKDPKVYRQVHSSVYFFHVQDIEYINIDQNNTVDFLNLLMIDADSVKQIRLIFADDREIYLYIDKIFCQVKDLHKPWCA